MWCFKHTSVFIFFGPHKALLEARLTAQLEVGDLHIAQRHAY